MKSRRMILVSLATIGALVASSVPAVRAQDADAVPLSLAECLSMALENNLDLAIAKKDPEIADLNVTFQEAAFDPRLGRPGRIPRQPQRDDQRVDGRPQPPGVHLGIRADRR